MGLNGLKCSQSLDRTHLEPAGGLAWLAVNGQTSKWMLQESKVAIPVCYERPKACVEKCGLRVEGWHTNDS